MNASKNNFLLSLLTGLIDYLLCQIPEHFKYSGTRMLQRRRRIILWWDLRAQKIETMLTKACGKITFLLWLLEQFQNVTCVTRAPCMTVQQSCNLLPKHFSQCFPQNTLFCWFLFVKNIFFITLSWFIFCIYKPTATCTHVVICAGLQVPQVSLNCTQEA